MEQCPQAIDIRAWSRLRFTILLRCSIAWGAESDGISSLSWLEVACNAKVDQIDVPIRGQHDVGRFEVAEDDGRLACMEIVKNGAELYCDFK